MKKCPFCAEEIQDEAIVCRYCRRDLPAPPQTATPATTEAEAATPVPPPASPRKRSSSNAILVAVVVGLILLVCIGVFGGCSAIGRSSPAEPTHVETPQESAWSFCVIFIQKQLGLSMMDSQDYNPTSVSPLGANTYLVEVIYAKQGSTYQCAIELMDNGDGKLWALDQVK